MPLKTSAPATGVVRWWARLGDIGLVLAVFVAGMSVAHAAEPVTSGPPPREVRVGVLVDNDPFSFRSPDGRVVGFAVDLLAGVERIMALRFERVVGPTDEINGAFLDGRLDLLQSYARSTAREGHADFSVPYLTLQGAIFVRRGLPEIRALADLRGRRVLVHAESLGARMLQAEGLADSIVLVASVEDALRRVDAGEGDATLATRLTGMAAIQRLGLQRIGPQGASVPGYEVEYCFAVRDGDRELLAQINEGLAVLVRTGEVDQLHRRWLGRYVPTGYSALEVMGAVAGGLAVALVVMIWAMLRQRTLRRRLARQTGALRESEERLRLALDAAHLGMFDWDLPRKHIMWSHRHEELWGYRAGEFGGRYEDFASRVHPADLSGVSSEIQRCLTGRDLFSREFRVVWPDGSERWVASSGEFEFDAAGQPQRMRGVVWEITARKRDEEEIRRLNASLEQRVHERTTQLEAANNELESFSYSVSHDLRAPLRTVTGFAQLLQRRHGNALNDEAQRYLEHIVQGGTRMGRLIDDLLNLSRLGRHAVPRQPVPLVEVLAAVMSDLGPRASEAGTQLVVAADLPAVLGDRTMLQQVFANLLGNALTYRRSGVTAHISVTAVTTAGHVTVTVRDNGIGFPPEQHERIFEVFQRLHGDEIPGTGIGLAIVKKCVELLGGRIAVQSAPGEGSAFSVELPRAP